jgi:hypothetical protein
MNGPSSEGRFALVISELRLPDAGPAHYSLYFQNDNVSEEAILSMVRLWLKDMEDKHRARLH